MVQDCFFLVGEIVVEGTGGDARRRSDGVGGDRIQSPVLGERDSRQAERITGGGLLLITKAGRGNGHASHGTDLAEFCNIA